jgi:hypothetical protein
MILTRTGEENPKLFYLEDDEFMKNLIEREKGQY